LVEVGTAGLCIVDGGGALVGFLPSAWIALAGMRALSSGLPPMIACAVSAPAVHERKSLSDAFSIMVARRVRELTVVGDGLQVVGALRDVDALRFVSHLRRTGERLLPD
jgi:CBS domain-containing protein